MDLLFPVEAVADDRRGTTMDEVLLGYAYPALAGGRWWLRANMVCSVDGAAAGTDGRSGSLATPPDRPVFHHLRGLSDAILVGAGTARAEDYGPPAVDDQAREQRQRAGQRPRPRMVVVSRSLALDPEARLFSGPDRVMVVTSRAADWARVERLGEVADVVRTGEEEVDLPEMLGLLADQGLRRLLCEGGPALLADMVATKVLDELCLTIVPVLTGGQARRITDGASPDESAGFALSSMVRAEDGTLLTRWVRA